jgi:diguanylate cyclase (GGDEF)-like protein
MDVSAYAVLTRAGRSAPLEHALSWPDADWPSWEEVGGLPQRALEVGGSVDDGTLCATPARAGMAAVVVVTPATSVLGVAVDLALTTTVAALLAAMYERFLLISGLVDLAHTDELTGLANRRRLFESLEHELARARRSGRPLSVAMIDLDHFKRYNDSFGHTAGDDLLRRFALRMARRVRAQDLVARYGGEEFCLVLPETETEGAMDLVDGLRAFGADHDPLGRRVSFSAGLATWDGAEAAEDLVFRADASLYRAKAAGRDRVVAAPRPARSWPPTRAGGGG